MRGRRSRVTILLALAVATAAAVVAYAAIANTGSKKTDPEAAVAAPPEVVTEPVVIAARDIPAGMTVTLDMLEVRQVPPEARSPRALVDPDLAVGRLTDVALTTGEQVLDTRLTDVAPDLQTFARDVPVGRRAISLVFDEVRGVGGLVQPGDHVDVIAFFEIKVDDLTIEEKPTEDEREAAEDDDASSDEADTGATDAPSDGAGGDDTGSDHEADVDYSQYVSVYVVQNLEVLAVSQALTPADVGVAGRDPDLASEEPDDAAASTGAVEPDPEVRPDALSVTLAATPEQAQRLLLAAQTVRDKEVERDAALRLTVRAPGDETIYELPPAQLGEIPIGGLLGDVHIPLTQTELLIVSVEFTKRIVNAGEVLEFRAVVKNVSDRTIASGRDAPPEYVYTQGVAYDDLGFFPEENTYRIGLNVASAYPTQFPYRWSLGRDLAPGESTTIVGSVQLTEPVPDARYWLGVIQEPNVITQDGVGVTDVTVLASEVVTVKNASASVLAAPDTGAAAVATVVAGDALTVMDARGPWFRVRVGGQEGWIAAGAIEAEPAPLPGPPGALGDAPDVRAAVSARLNPWR